MHLIKSNLPGRTKNRGILSRHALEDGPACRIAHDLNNVLTVILGNIQLAMQGIPESSALKRNLEEAVRAGCRGRDMVKKILDEKCRNKEASPIRMGSLVNESLQMVRSILPPGIKIRISIADDGQVMADPIQIHRIIMNLCTNAIQAMEEKGGILEVSLKKVRLDIRPATYFKLVVRDTGHGIAPDIIDKIFHPFFTTKTRGAGTGLGLTVVREIVSSYQGFIACNSTPGKGSAFEVYIPAKDAKKRKRE
jgi:signal transduction histidine kinase